MKSLPRTFVLMTALASLLWCVPVFSGAEAAERPLLMAGCKEFAEDTHDYHIGAGLLLPRDCAKFLEGKKQSASVVSRTYSKLSLVAEQHRDYDKALEILNEGIAERNDLSLYESRGKLYLYRLNERDKGVQDFETIFQKGNRFEKSKITDKLLQYYQTAELYAPYIETISRLITAYEEEDRDWRIGKSEIQILFQNRAFAHEKMGNWELAIADYNAGLEINPENVFLLLSRCEALYTSGDLAAAEAGCLAAAEVTSKRPGGLGTFTKAAQIALERGNMEGAIQHLAKVLTRTPNDQQALSLKKQLPAEQQAMLDSLLQQPSTPE